MEGPLTHLHAIDISPEFGVVRQHVLATIGLYRFGGKSSNREKMRK